MSRDNQEPPCNKKEVVEKSNMERNETDMMSLSSGHRDWSWHGHGTTSDQRDTMKMGKEDSLSPR